MGQMGTTPPAGLVGALAAIALLTAGCATIPPESVELSQTLGTQLDTLESAHEAAIRAFFDAKETAVHKFMEDEWTPKFANNYLSSPKVSAMLAQTCGQQHHADCLHAILIISNQAELQIQAHYRKILEPLSQTETTLLAAVRADYAEAEHENDALTALLISATKVQSERQTLLAKAGINESQIDSALTTVSDQVSHLTSNAKSLDSKLAEFSKTMKTVRDSLHRDTTGGS